MFKKRYIFKLVQNGNFLFGQPNRYCFYGKKWKSLKSTHYLDKKNPFLA